MLRHKRGFRILHVHDKYFHKDCDATGESFSGCQWVLLLLSAANEWRASSQTLKGKEGTSQQCKVCRYPVRKHSLQSQPSKSMFPSALMSSSFRISSSSPFFSFSPSSVLTASFISSWLIFPSPSRSNCRAGVRKAGEL